MLLHGPNGAGKTTILRLLWDLLSPADNRGHRSAIARVPFRSFEVQMTGGARIAAIRDGELTGGFAIVLERPGIATVTVPYAMLPDRDAVRAVRRAGKRGPRGARTVALKHDGRTYVIDSALDSREGADDESEYLEFLRTVAPKPLLLGDDRMLASDEYDPHSDDSLALYRESLLQGASTKRKSNVAELERALDRANDYLRELTLGGQDAGSANSHEIYARIIRQFADSGNSREQGSNATLWLRKNVATLVKEISQTAPRFEEFGLVPPIDADEISSLLAKIEGSESERIALEIVEPFVDSLVARYRALSSAEETLRSFVPTLNEFLRDKQVTFRPREGLRFVAHSGESLEPSLLSSGERQLAMLLSTTLLAAQESSIFIVDEPELSLGVTWQRMILDALLRVTKGSSLQFIVATHSIEILTGHAESIVVMGQDG